jgi:hypothetical protein
LPNKSLRSNARNAATGKSLAKCEKPLISGHLGEHWLILCPWRLTVNGGMFPVVLQVRKPPLYPFELWERTGHRGGKRFEPLMIHGISISPIVGPPWPLSFPASM